MKNSEILTLSRIIVSGAFEPVSLSPEGHMKIEVHQTVVHLNCTGVKKVMENIGLLLIYGGHQRLTPIKCRTLRNIKWFHNCQDKLFYGLQNAHSWLKSE